MLVANSLYAAHLFSAEITYKALGNQEFEVRLYQYRECDPAFVVPDSLPLTFGSMACNEPNQIRYLFYSPSLSGLEGKPLCPGSQQNSKCLGGAINSEKLYVYIDTISLAACSDWLIGYTYTQRLSTLTNIDRPSSGTMYVSTMLSTLPNASADYFGGGIIPIAYICKGEEALIDVSTPSNAFDSIRYELIAPLEDESTAVIFRPGLSSTQFLNTNSPVTIDSETGVIKFVPANFSQKAVFAVRTKRWLNGTLVTNAVREHWVDVGINCSYAAIQMDTFFVESATECFTNKNQDVFSFCQPDTVHFNWVLSNPQGDSLLLDTARMHLDAVFGAANYAVKTLATLSGQRLEVQISAFNLIANNELKIGRLFVQTEKPCVVVNQRVVPFSFQQVVKQAFTILDTSICINESLIVNGPSFLSPDLLQAKLLSETNLLNVVAPKKGVFQITLPPNTTAAQNGLELGILNNTGCIQKDTFNLFLKDTTAIQWRFTFKSGKVDSILIQPIGQGANDYLWNTGDTTIGVKQTNLSTYTCKITNAEGCVSEVSIPALVDNVNKFKYKPIRAYPNPVEKGTIFIIEKGDYPKGAQCYILNALGQAVEILDEKDGTWQWKPIREGLYRFCITTGDGGVWSQAIRVYR